MYENLTDKNIIIDCGKELNRDGEFNAMIINITLLSITMDELNNTDKPVLNTNESNWTLVGWNRKMDSVND